MLTALALWNIGCGVLFILMGLPLAIGKVPRTSWYGVRFKKALQSDRTWYAVNAYVGRRVIYLAIVLIAIGVYALVSQLEPTDGILWMYALAPVMVAGLTGLDAYMYLKRIG